MFSRFGARGDSSAGDQRQTSCHTTRNVFVLYLFLFATHEPESMVRLGPVVGQFEMTHSAGLSFRGDRPSTSVRKDSTSITIRVSAGRHSTAPT